MIKAKDFWLFLCEKLNYRFFSGVPCLGLKPLYDKMSSKFLHYVPAVNEHAAFGISVGAVISEAKAGVIVDALYLNTFEDWIQYCNKNRIHLVILTNDDVKSVPSMVVKQPFDEIDNFLRKYEKKSIPVALVLKEISK